MGNDLDRAAQVIAVAFPADHLGVHLAGGHIAIAVQANIDETFVMPQVQVGFCAIIQDVDLTMLIGRHRPGIDIDIRVEFLNGDFYTALFEQPPDGSSGDAFADRADHTAGKTDISCSRVTVCHGSLSG